MIGIYRIRNLINDKCYYGSSKNIEKRWKRHKSDLKNNHHHNIILQRSWNKYGKENFIFEIVEICENNELFEKEQIYLDNSPNYNIGKKASGGDNLTNNPNKKEIITKISESVNKRYSLMTDEEKKMQSSKPMENNPNWKGGISYNYCKCGKRISISAKTCKKCEDIKGNRNPFYGKHHTVENKKYYSDLYKGKCLHNGKIEITINNADYESYKDAEKKLNILWGTIRYRVLSKNPKYINYNFKGNKKICYTKEELKDRHGKEMIGINNYSNNKPIIIDNVEYRTLGDASKALNIHKMTIKGRLLSKKFENYKYKNES